MATAQRISTCLHYNGDAEAAVQSYVDIFDDGRIVSVQRYGDDAIMPKGTALMVEFELLGTRFAAINGPADWTFSETCSLLVDCDGQAEVDRYWDALLAAGAEPVACGWIKDRFGLCWQIVPTRFGELMRQGDEAANMRMMQALYRMVKLDVAALEAAHAGA